MARVSKVIPFAAMALIPLSWMVQILYNNHIVRVLTDGELSADQINAIKDMYVNVPMAALITFATVSITAIMGRKAAREATNNMGKKEDYEDKA